MNVTRRVKQVQEFLVFSGLPGCGCDCESWFKPSSRRLGSWRASSPAGGNLSNLMPPRFRMTAPSGAYAVPEEGLSLRFQRLSGCRAGQPVRTRRQARARRAGKAEKFLKGGVGGNSFRTCLAFAPQAARCILLLSPLGTNEYSPAFQRREPGRNNGSKRRRHG